MLNSVLAYPSLQLTVATILALTGAWLAYRGTRAALGGVFQPGQDNCRLLTRLQGFRLAIIGLSVLGVMIGWTTGNLWLIVLSLGIGGEEILESSVMISAIRWGQKCPA